MAHRWLVNLLLLVVVAALGNAARHDLDRADQVLTLTGLDAAGVVEVVLERPEKPALRVVRTPDGWAMEVPYAAPADDDRIERLLGVVSAAVRRTLPDGASEDELGLTAPEARLVVDGIELRFGDTDPVSGHRYVAAGDQVHLIEDVFHHHLISNAEDYVDRHLLPPGMGLLAGSLDGNPLSAQALDELRGVTAERVEPMGEEITGRLLSVKPAEAGSALRFLVSADARTWTRIDLRLSYLVAAPPFWALVEEAMAPEPVQ